jgi:hypothetical protein
MFESLTGDILGSLANSSSLNRRREGGIEFSVLWCSISRDGMQSDTQAGFSAAQDSEKELSIVLEDAGDMMVIKG